MYSTVHPKNQHLCTHTCESVVEDVVLLQHATSRVEDTNTTLLPVVYLVPPQDRVRVRLDPHSGQGIAVNVVLYQKTLPRVVDKDPTIFTTEDLVSLDDWIAASSVENITFVIRRLKH